MSPRINAEAPNFEAQTTQGTIDFHTRIGDSWTILFSQPKDFTPVRTAELTLCSPGGGAVRVTCCQVASNDLPAIT